MKREVLSQLNKVLDDQGNPKACGRENCKRAIWLANLLYPEVDYGDVETGMMKVENLNSLRKELENELKG